MATFDTDFSNRYPNTHIESGAVIPGSCRVGAGCELGREVRLGEDVLLERNVRLLGAVKLKRGVIVRQNSLLMGPLDVGEETVFGVGAKFGVVLAPGEALSKPARIAKSVRIGVGAEILGGVVLGEFSRVRARSRVMGDVPAYGLAGGDPAVLENYICAYCSAILRPTGRTGDVYNFACPVCANTRIRIPANESRPKPSYVLLPGGKSGVFVSLAGYDPSWEDLLEMRFAG